jgi:hypothetical protein
MVLRQIIDEVMFEIRALSGQEYVDTYATKQADALPGELAQVEGSARPAPERRSSAEVLGTASGAVPVGR